MTDCQLQYVAAVDEAAWCADQRAAGRQVEAWLARCGAFARETFMADPVQPEGAAEADETAGQILRVLLHREFNYRATGRVAHLLPDLRDRIGRIVAEGRPVPLYLLHHGGYRASSGPALDDLVFTPDATELLLLHQIARLQRAIAAVYPPGIAFVLVVNNGVAAETNDIPLAATTGYATALADMIAALGGAGVARVLVQSALAPGAPLPIGAAVAVDEAGHRNIERFLGRTCSVGEAGERAARYIAAEAAWWQRIGAIVAADSGLILRQVADPSCLSFRPFPGGAIRAQNGSVGVALRDGGRDPLPFLVTTTTARQRRLVTIPIRRELLVAGQGG